MSEQDTLAQEMRDGLEGVPNEKWWRVIGSGVRNKAGFFALSTGGPCRYPNQEARYEREVREQNATEDHIARCSKPNITALLDERDELTAEVARLREALEPSGATKCAYIGEFQFNVRLGYDENGDEIVEKVGVPWTTIKEIMAAIRTHAALKDNSA